jgi:hypothetical protein
MCGMDYCFFFTENIITGNIDLDKLQKFIFSQTDDTESKYTSTVVS